MKVIFNGAPIDASDCDDVSTLLEKLKVDTTRIALALNGRIIPRHRLVHIALQELDRIDVIKPIAGG